ncbi:tetratricopeptide repeat protein [Salsuginibacillus kocurii]|uniref:tetratricopeptide repeat protein n=1 Tax=Salsuginibacillus kocurii TaxID=427078 RepID=UPI000375D105|nr:tetratricopeptide repeat protein [Salsuginibacillus kocurii]
MTSNTNQKGSGRVLPFVQSGEHFFRRGVRAYQHGDFRRAVKYLQRAIELKPREGVFRCQLAAVLSDTGEHERSNEILHYVLDHINERMYECYFFLANNYAHLGLFDKAAESVSTYLAHQPNGEFQEEAQNLLEAVQDEQEEEETEDINSSDDELIINYERACRYMNDEYFEKAAHLLDGIMVDYPNFWSAYTKRAELLHAQNRTDEAIVFLKELLAEESYLPAMCQLALYLDELGRFEARDELLESLKSVVPIDRGHARKLADVLCALGSYERAHHWYVYLVKQQHEVDAEIFFRAGVCAFHVGEYRLARNRFEQAKDMGHSAAELLVEKENEGLLSSGDVRCDLTHNKYGNL